MSSRQLPAFLAHDAPGTTTALVFGPEDNGLTREELEGCEPVVTIPSAPDHPTLNLAQSVLILAYELHLAQAPNPQNTTRAPTTAAPVQDTSTDIAPPATGRELETLLERAETVLEEVGIDQRPRRAVYLREMRRFARRGAATSHEIRLLLRLANRTLFALSSRRQVTGASGGRKVEEDDRVRSAEPQSLSRRRLDE